MTFQHEEKEPFFSPYTISSTTFIKTKREAWNSCMMDCTTSKPKQGGEKKQSRDLHSKNHTKISIKNISSHGSTGHVRGVKEN